MQTLKITHETHNKENTFVFALTSKGAESKRVGYLFDCGSDGLCIVQGFISLQEHYSSKDVADRERLNALAPVRNGDVVLVDGKKYAVKIVGDYADAGRLIPV